jgi:biopolymer transport protein ExbB/TolQ
MKKSAKVMIAGAVLFVGSLILGVGGTVVGMISSFNQVASSGQADTEEVSEAIGTSLIPTMIGMPIAFIGLCLLVGGVIAYFVGSNKIADETNNVESV